MQLISGISVYLASSEVCESVCECVCECESACVCLRVCLWICLRLFVDWASLTAAHLLTVPSRERGWPKGGGETRSMFPGDALAARVIPDSTPRRESWVCECAECAPTENEF